jgi:hypothetical protein
MRKSRQSLIPPGKLVRGCGLAMALVLPTLPVIGSGSAEAASTEEATARTSEESALAAYRAMAATQSRNYDKAQDISARQMVVML